MNLPDHPDDPFAYEPIQKIADEYYALGDEYRSNEDLMEKIREDAAADEAEIIKNRPDFEPL